MNKGKSGRKQQCVRQRKDIRHNRHHEVQRLILLQKKDWIIDDRGFDELNGIGIPQKVEQGCLILFLEIYLPAKFSSNPDQTHMNQLIKIFRSVFIIFIFIQMCLIRVESVGR